MSHIQMRLKNFTTNKILSDNRGIVVIEFAMVLPLLLLILFGLFEITRYIIIHYKAEKMAFSLVDLAAQGSKVCDGDIDTFMIAANQIVAPYDTTGIGAVFTSVAKPVTEQDHVGGCEDGKPCVTWQKTRGSAPASKVGSGENSAPVMPGSMEIVSGQNYIIVETNYTYKPLLGISANIIPFIEEKDIYTLAVEKPRYRQIMNYCN